MYITCLAASPWAKIDSLRANVATFLPRPVESRNAFTSKTRLRDFVLFGGRGTLIATLRVADDAIGKINMGRGQSICSKLHTLGWRAPELSPGVRVSSHGRTPQARVLGSTFRIRRVISAKRACRAIELLTMTCPDTSIEPQGRRVVQIKGSFRDAY